MTKWPNFIDPQFLDANGTGGLVAAMGTVSGAIASVGSGAWALPGLIAPDSASISFSGMVATINLPAPWGVVSSSGVVVRAHGTLTGQDTTSYTVNFASLVPGTGSVTAYAAATIQQIQQNPFPVPGPPPGFPSYNPNYVPTVGYASNVYTVNLTATTSAPDNVSSFELLRTTLVAGQSAVTGFSTAGWTLAADRKAWPQSPITSGGALAPNQAQRMIFPTVPGLTHTLPTTAKAGGLEFGFFNPTSGTYVVAASGTDVITGFAANNVVATIAIPSSGSINLYGDPVAGAWRAVATSPGFITHGLAWINATGNFTVPLNVTFVEVEVWAGGGGGGAADVSGGAGSGGSGGGYARGVINVTPGQVIACAVGAGGAGAVAGSAPGGNGVASSFGGVVGAQPGTGGNSTSTATAPAAPGGSGFGIGGVINVVGGLAGQGYIVSAGALGIGGFGGGAFSSSVSFGNTALGIGGYFPGGGGSGGANGNHGGPGAPGAIFIRW